MGNNARTWRCQVRSAPAAIELADWAAVFPVMVTRLCESMSIFNAKIITALFECGLDYPKHMYHLLVGTDLLDASDNITLDRNQQHLSSAASP